MSANIFNFFKRLSLNHNIHYINCVEDPEKAAFGFIRTQLLNGKDPKDTNIRIAPSFPTVEELGLAAEIFVLSVKLVSVDKLLNA